MPAPASPLSASPFAPHLYHDHIADAIHAVRHTTPAPGLPAGGLWLQTLQDAVRGAGCTESVHNWTVCAGRGEAIQALDDPVACEGPLEARGAAAGALVRWSTGLDLRLGSGPRWARCPGGRVRPVLTAHYLEEGRGSCASSGPWLLRVHHYCEDPLLAPPSPPPGGGAGGGSGGGGGGGVGGAGGGGLHLAGVMHGARTTAGAAPRGRASSAFLDTAPLSTSASRRLFEQSDPLRCQLEAFLPTPALCRDAAVSGRGAARLEALLASLDASRTSGFSASGEEEEGAASRGKEATYGELSAEGMVQLLTGWPDPFPLGAASLLVDVGSGVGKLLFAAALLTQSRGRGVEYVEARAALAERALAAAARDGFLTADEAARVELLHADGTAPGVLQGATHVYMANLCFPDELNVAMVAALAALPTLRCVATLRRLPLEEAWPDDAAACSLAAVEERPVGMSWADNVGVTYYCCEKET